MRALELDPHHFYEVEQEPVHHDHHYYSEFDAHDDESHSDDYSDDEDVYYEHLIGTGHAAHDFSGESQWQSSLSFSSYNEDEDNDILFNINDDLQFKLDADDNYEGRDVDIGIRMPGAKSITGPMAHSPEGHKIQARSVPTQSK